MDGRRAGLGLARAARRGRCPRWLSRHRTAVTGAAAAVLAGVVGLSAVLAVQTRPTPSSPRSLARETTANTALADANDELMRSKAAVQARYDLAVEAIKTFHTGVSEDFLLKQDQFKELRPAAEIGSPTSTASSEPALQGDRRGFAAGAGKGQLRGGRPDEKVGRKEDAPGSAPRGAGLPRGAGKRPGGRSGSEGRRRPKPDAIASLLNSTGKIGEAEATYRQAESLLADLMQSSSPASPAVRAVLAHCRSRLGLLLSSTGRSADAALAAYRLAQADQQVLAGATGATDEARATWRRQTTTSADYFRQPESCRMPRPHSRSTGGPAEARRGKSNHYPIP